MITNLGAGPLELYFRRGQGILFFSRFRAHPATEAHSAASYLVRTLGSDCEVNHLHPRFSEV
jgi:hypothetical protein